MKTKLVSFGLILVPAALFGQDNRVLGDAIGHFKGVADEVRKANPVLAVGTGEGVSAMMKGLSIGRRSSGKGPVSLNLPKDQQEELERRAAARERAERLAKAGPRRVAPVAKPAESGLPAITPLVMLAILHPQPKPQFDLVNEQDVLKVKEGQSRIEVLTALGKPSSVAAVNGLEDGSREVLTYHLAPNRTAAVRLHSGLVTSVAVN